MNIIFIPIKYADEHHYFKDYKVEYSFKQTQNKKKSKTYE